jgi:HK97 family phage major capsid protein
MKKFFLSIADRLHLLVLTVMYRGGLIAFDTPPDLTAITKALGELSDQCKTVGEKALKEAQTAGELSTKTRVVVDELLTKQGTMQKQYDDLMLKITEQSKKAEPEGDELESILKKALPDIKGFVDSRQQNGQLNIPVTRKALTNSGVTGAALTYPGTQVLARPLEPLQRQLTIRDLLAPGRISGPVLFYQRETGFTNNAAPVSEGSLKPKSELTFELITEPVRTLAHLFDVSLQMLSDVPYIRSYIETRGMYGLKYVEENQLLTGSGTGQNLSGIYTEATAYAAPTGATVNGQPAGGPNEQDLDKLRLALLQVELAFAFANGIILHPTDWASIELLKDSTGQYLFTNPQNTTTARIWGRSVVTTPAMTQGRFMVGDFARYAQIFDREDANVAISFENKDNFERNMATIRVEERLALAIYRPEAFVKGTLESAS